MIFFAGISAGGEFFVLAGFGVSGIADREKPSCDAGFFTGCATCVCVLGAMG